MTKLTTIETLTETQIRTLRHEAVEAGDLRAMVICDVALDEADDADDYMAELQDVVRTWSREDARRSVVEMISDAEAARTTERTADAWWTWHDAESSRWSSDQDEAEARCEAWVSGDSDDGPSA